MNPPDEAWLSLLVIALLGLLYFLRVKFPNASKPAETAVLIAVTVAFFSICNFFLNPHKSAAAGDPLRTQKQAVVWKQ